jgi:hypothetical protein
LIPAWQADEAEMQFLRLWSFWKVLLVSGGWVLLSILLVAAWIAFQFRSVGDSSAGSGGIGAVSIGISVFIFTQLIPFGPPIVLFLAWLIARRS